MTFAFNQCFFVICREEIYSDDAYSFQIIQNQPEFVNFADLKNMFPVISCRLPVNL